MTKWEYLSFGLAEVTDPMIDEVLNKYGQEGWELVNAIPRYFAVTTAFPYRVFLKRPVKDAA